MGFIQVIMAYALFAIGFMLVQNYRVRRNIRTSGVPNGFDANLFVKAQQGKMASQIFSFILSIALLAILVVGSLSILISTITGYNPNFDTSYVTLFSLLALPPLTLMTIISDACWIYKPSVRYAKQHAFMSKTASKLLKSESICSWIAWACYSAIGVTIVILFATSAIVM